MEDKQLHDALMENRCCYKEGCCDMTFKVCIPGYTGNFEVCADTLKDAAICAAKMHNEAFRKQNFVMVNVYDEIDQKVTYRVYIEMTTSYQAERHYGP